MAKWNGKPIRNCPGRYILTDAPPACPPDALLAPGVEIRQFQVEAARDIVIVAQFETGGLISYKRADGTYLHTLNTPEGFQRKLLQLGIAWPDEHWKDKRC